MATWLDSFFHGFDFGILQAVHGFAEGTGGFFSPLLHLITTLGDGGIGLIILGLLLSCFRRTRKVGFTVLFAVAIGAIFTNLTIKPLVARARPYTHEAYAAWWQSMGAHLESEKSFPSGHTTATMAAMTAVFLTTPQKYSWTAFLFALLMGFTRLYFVVHYPSDILGGLLIGAVGAVLAYLLVCKLLLPLLERKREGCRICRFVLEADAIALLRRIFGKKAPADAPVDAPAEAPTEAPVDAPADDTPKQ